MIGLLMILVRLLLVYLSASIVLGYIPVNTGFSKPEEGIDIFIVSNGVHTDFVLPMINDQMNWSNLFGQEDFGRRLHTAPWIAFGWGDRGFYLNTPEWSDLTPSTAIKALLLPSHSAMHVTLTGKPSTSDRVIQIRINEVQYSGLKNYILGSFLKDPRKKAIRIDHPGYGMNDLFFESDLSFHLLRTCNVWTSNGLNTAGIRTSVWTPFDRPILYQLGRIE
jgi:uncharacterized protein (TIGR02117 family)